MDTSTFLALAGQSATQPGKAKFFGVPSATQKTWMPGHCNIVGFWTNGKSMAVTKDGQTYAQLQAQSNASNDAVCIIFDSTTEFNMGMVYVEVAATDTLTISNNGLADYWIQIYYVPIAS